MCDKALVGTDLCQSAFQQKRQQVGCVNNEFSLRPREMRRLWETALNGKTNRKQGERTEERDAEDECHDGDSGVDICYLIVRVVETGHGQMC
jgi:hypothetical protein